ncbi:Serine/threonine-protein kinase 36 [Fasciola gigantica]|uniref:non-specific serine/threonine protein kinase n=1 Tax=Fasciola gigantica TaxID=46835 RepID=A0A504YFB9_FASGI|nr:Serine/threonine-protein kinase 36 [Fasciola gigantica]
MKPQNILLGQDGVVKLCDFGFARVMNLNDMVLTSIKGTPLYMAPELVEEKPYDHTADLCIFHLVKLITETPIKWSNDMSPEFKDFLARLLQKDTRKRLQWPELLDHPFVASGVEIYQRTRLLSSPFTQPLTPSQLAEKERQTKQMCRPRGSRMLRRMGGERVHSLRQLKEEEKLSDSACRQSNASTTSSRASPRWNSVYEGDLARQASNTHTPVSKARPNSSDISRYHEFVILQHVRRNSERNPEIIDSKARQPTPRTDRISADYDREKQVYEQYLSVKRAETFSGAVNRRPSQVTRPLDQFSDIRDQDSFALDKNDRAKRKPSSAKTSVLGSHGSQRGSGDIQQENKAKQIDGWWLRESVEAWERLVDATEVDFTAQSSSDNEHTRPSLEQQRKAQRRTALSLLRDADFGRRVALRLSSATVIADGSNWQEIQPWVEALAERRILISRHSARPASAGTHGIKDTSSESIPGLEAAAYLRTILRLLTNLITVKCIQHYTENALCFMDLVPELVNQSCDIEFHLRDQTLLCLRYMMERMVDREPAIVHRFYEELVKHHLPAIKILMHMPSISRHTQEAAEVDSQRVEDVREHALAALTAFTYPLITTIHVVNTGDTKPMTNLTNEWIQGPHTVKITTQELFYDCIQADSSFAVHCVEKLSSYLDTLFEILQKKITVSEPDQSTLTEIATHSLTALLVQVGHVPQIIQQHATKLYGMFVESQGPGHAAALALTLARLGPTDLSEFKVKPREVAQAIAQVLLSPLAQSQTDRTRLLSGMFESVAAEIARTSRGSREQPNDFEVSRYLGLPQLNWPANHGWLDGVFELAYQLCCRLGDTFIQLCIETRILDCLWHCLEQVFDLNLINNPTRSLHPPDWGMLSPRGVYFVLQLGKLIYTKERKFCVEALCTNKSQMLHSLTYLFTDTCIKSLIQSPWVTEPRNEFIGSLQSNAAQLLQMPFDVKNDCHFDAVPRQYVESELFVYLLRAATRLLYNLPLDGSRITSQSVHWKPTTNSIMIARVQSLLNMCFRICVGPYTEDKTGNGSKSSNSSTQSASNTSEMGVALLCSAFLRDQLTNLFLESKVESSNSSVTLVHELVRWCLHNKSKEMQAGACGLLNRLVLCGIVEGTRYRQNSDDPSKQVYRTNDLKFASSRELVWTLLNTAQSAGNTRSSDQTLVDFLNSTDSMARVHVFCLVASLILCCPSDEASCDPSNSPSPQAVLRQNFATAGSNGYLLEQQVCRPHLPRSIDEPVDSQSLTTSEHLWTEYFKRCVSIAVDTLKDPEVHVRQAALLVVGNALYRFSQSFELAEKHLDTLINMLLEDSLARVRVEAAGT